MLGAWIGVTTGITRAMSPGIGLVVFLVGAFGFMFVIERNKNSAAGVPLLLAFTFFMGVMLSRLVGSVLGLSNGAGLIMDGLRRHRCHLPGHGHAVVDHQARPVLDGQVPLHWRDHAAGGRRGELHFIQSSALMITLSVLAIGIFSAFNPVRPEACAGRP